MFFVVKYRGKDGALCEEVVAAQGRAECVAACRKRGITPMGIVEDRPRGDRAPSVATSSSASAWKRIVLLSAAILAIAAIVWWWFTTRSASAPYQGEVPKKSVKSDEVVPPKGGNSEGSTAPKNSAVPPKPATNAVAEKVIQTPFGEKRVKPHYSKAVQAALASADAPPVVDLRPPPPDPNSPPPPPPRYKNNLQLQLSEYAWSGRFVGVPDPISNKEARKLVEEPVEFLPDDTPEVRQEKETVVAMQKELKEYMERGGRANDYFMKLMERQDAENETIREAKKQIRELCKAGDFELAEQAQSKFNEYLKGKGLPPLAMSKYLKHAKVLGQAVEGKGQGTSQEKP